MVNVSSFLQVSKGCKTFCDTGKAFCDSMGLVYCLDFQIISKQSFLIIRQDYSFVDYFSLMYPLTNFVYQAVFSCSPFTEGISDLAEHFKADEEIKDAYTTFSEHLEEIKSFYSVNN